MPLRIRRLRLLRREDGIALIVALGVMTVLAIAGTTAMAYASQNQRTAGYSKADQVAFSLAEAGINNAMAVLSQPSNNALKSTLLPSSEATANVNTYENGTVKWWGTFNQATGTWRLTARGYVRNPTGPAGSPTNPLLSKVRRTITTDVQVVPSYAQPLNNMAWNYIYVTKTSDPDGCDQVLNNSANMGAPMFVNGNLCLQTPSQVTGGPLVVKGQLKLDVNTNVGSTGAPVGEVHVAGGCQYKNQAMHTPCSPADYVWGSTVDNVPPPVSAPVADFDGWYQNSSPGPMFPCYGPSSYGPYPVLDNDTVRNNSVPGVADLTPSVSYECWTSGGELKWDATTKTLTVNGTIYIDGSAKIDNGYVNQYNGQASIYLSGTLYIHNSKMCGGLSADKTTCDFASWNPNTEMLIFVAAGNGGQIPVGDSIQLVSSYLQGGLYAQNSIELDTTSVTEGPMIAGEVIIGQTTTTKTFPYITTVPAGIPGNPVIYAEPQPPANFAG